MNERELILNLISKKNTKAFSVNNEEIIWTINENLAAIDHGKNETQRLKK
jgi:hypothetical protein